MIHFPVAKSVGSLLQKGRLRMQPVTKSAKLNNVCYDIRGPVLERAKQMEEEGHKIIKLN
ncbi:MAG: aminotransferase, partial [Rugosibacter sp.]|nr:aminotransferase [Rugosibacter sp.]